MSRTTNSLKNITASIGGQLLNNLLRWVCRIVFIQTLGKDYLGISSLYLNILTVLSLGELGLGSAITYCLYAPLAVNDKETVKSQMHFFKKAYTIIGLGIFAAGLCVIPFLPTLMKGTTDAVNIYEYYILYLLHTVVSYLFFAYKGILLIADQRKYISDTIIYLVQMAMNLIQIFILLILRSFFLYVIIFLLSEVMKNILVAVAVDKWYPYLKEKARKLTRKERNKIFKRVYAMSLYRVAAVVGTATDNLVISSNISVLFVGLYDNYFMVIQVIQKIVHGIFTSFTSSLGNYFVTESLEDNEKMFRMLNRANSWVVIFCSVSFATMLQPFISLCFGKDYLLDHFVAMIIVLNFTTEHQQNVVQIYKDVSGLFVIGKYRALATAVLNVILSVILVRTMGLAGVFIGSIVSRLVTTWWYDARLLFRKGFHKSPLPFYLDCAVMIGVIALSTVIIEFVCQGWVENTFLSLLVRGICCIIVPNMLCLLLYGRSEECHELYRRGREVVERRFLKRNREE